MVWSTKYHEKERWPHLGELPPQRCSVMCLSLLLELLQLELLLQRSLAPLHLACCVLRLFPRNFHIVPHPFRLPQKRLLRVDLLDAVLMALPLAVAVKQVRATSQDRFAVLGKAVCRFVPFESWTADPEQPGLPLACNMHHQQ